MEYYVTYTKSRGPYTYILSMHVHINIYILYVQLETYDFQRREMLPDSVEYVWQFYFARQLLISLNIFSSVLNEVLII